MSRIIVIGGRGWFGSAITELLRREGLHPLIASRSAGADMRADAEDPHSLEASLRAGDIVIDTAGPIQRRSTALVEACLQKRCDVIDISDSLDYARRVQTLAAEIERAGITVLTSCSSVSAVSAALLRLSGVETPVAMSAFLAPATRNTSTSASGRSLLATLERPIQVWRDGSFVAHRAFSEERQFTFPAPVGKVSGRLAETPDALLLPPRWPTLRNVDFWVDTRRSLLNALFATAARSRTVLAALRAMQSLGRRASPRPSANAREASPSRSKAPADNGWLPDSCTLLAASSLRRRRRYWPPKLFTWGA